ncbi:hypothetical protein [Bosea sp. 124]|uniref:hypothetical protein n=1 Tax=Bosea sp. 124 TaxID=2135642 RepID=UPI0015E64961|nr:hypothetical protein [Bosea sp. 124]
MRAVENLAAFVGVHARDAAIARGGFNDQLSSLVHCLIRQPDGVLEKRIEPNGSMRLDMREAPRYFKFNRTDWFELF